MGIKKAINKLLADIKIDADSPKLGNESVSPAGIWNISVCDRLMSSS